VRVYIAGPYTKGDVAVNVRMALKAAHEIREMGFTPFCPHLTHFWHMLFPREYKDWLEMDLVWLEQCQCVVRLPGESSGADGEVERAEELGIPVYYGIDQLRRAA
jgi:hypothetical protein